MSFMFFAVVAFSLIIYFVTYLQLYLKNSNSIRTRFASSNENVAVCIGGQLGRLQPQFIHESLFNANPNVNFHVFYNLQLQNPFSNSVILKIILKNQRNEETHLFSFFL